MRKMFTGLLLGMHYIGYWISTNAGCFMELLCFACVNECAYECMKNICIDRDKFTFVYEIIYKKFSSIKHIHFSYQK